VIIAFQGKSGKWEPLQNPGKKEGENMDALIS
jgi:hypothetical protein